MLKQVAPHLPDCQKQGIKCQFGDDVKEENHFQTLAHRGVSIFQRYNQTDAWTDLFRKWRLASPKFADGLAGRRPRERLQSKS